jgi:hypothetical protein
MVTALASLALIVNIAIHHLRYGVFWPMILTPAFLVVHTIVFYTLVLRCSLYGCGLPSAFLQDGSSVLRFNSISTILFMLLEVRLYGLPRS